MNFFSENHKILVEPYKSDRAIRGEVKKGFSTIAQKSNLVGLRVIVGAGIADKGQIAYFKEEDLHAQAWAKTVFSCKDLEEKFIIADSRSIVMIAWEDQHDGVPKAEDV